MRQRHRFIPSVADQLEERVVLSRTTLGLSTVVSGLSPHLRVLNRQQTALIAEVNQAFDSFQSDYDQALRDLFRVTTDQPELGQLGGERVPGLHAATDTAPVPAAHQQLRPDAAGHGQGTEPAVCAEAVDRIQGHRAERKRARGLVDHIARRHHPADQRLDADIFADDHPLYAQPGQCHRDGSDRRAQRREYHEERGLRYPEGLPLLRSWSRRRSARGSARSFGPPPGQTKPRRPSVVTQIIESREERNDRHGLA